MSRGSFSSGNVLQIDSAVLNSYPLTMACWFNGNNVAGSGTQMWLGSRSVDQEGIGIVAGSDIFAAYDYSGSYHQSVAGSVSNGIWYHGAGLFESSAKRTGVLNGIAGTPETTSLTDNSGNWNRTALGYLARISATSYFDGYVAWPAIWNVILNSEELAALAAGAHPLTIRPDALVAVWDCVGVTASDGEPDTLGGFPLGVVGSVGVVDSPIITLVGPQVATFSSPAPPTGFMPAWVSQRSGIIGAGVR